MHNDGNVVPLRKATTDQATPSPLARLPVILLQVRDKATQRLRRGLQDLFDNADDTLFAMADRAQNDVEQNIFFEAMRDLRLKRKSIERVFFEQFFEAFISLSQYGISQTALLRPLSIDLSTTPTDDELERTVAIEAMVTKVLSRDGYALDQLTARLSTLLGRGLVERCNPVGPTMLCDCFLQAARHLGVEIKVKLIILKLFDQYVLSDAGRLYAEANQLLCVTGVLPDMSPAPFGTSGGRESAHDTPAPTNMPLDDTVTQVFTGLQDLLCHVRRRAGATPQAQSISTRDLLRLLSHLQQYLPAPTAEGDADLRNQLEHLLIRARDKNGRPRVIGAADEDVINLISMLFDCILDDRSLPDALKSLIGRLQIPMAKVAVLDKSFFSRSSHPARRLLNEIASAALGWSGRDDRERDNLYLRIEKVVQCLLDDFVDDLAIFSELLADFLDFTSDERRRSELLEQRIRDAEEGRARAALARQHVEQALNHVLLGKVLPQTVLVFVQQAWSKVLLLSCLKYGEQSVQWRDDVQTMEQLIWSVQRHDEPEARSSLLALVPGLLKALRDGLSRSAFDPFATSDFFSELEQLHIQMFEHSGAYGESVMVEVLENIVLLPAEASLVETVPVGLSMADEGLGQVAQLRLGNWVELHEDPENILRCKLAAIIEASGQYIFVDRTGMKVREYARSELAVQFRSGKVRALDDTLLFERALESVIGRLRRLDSGK